GRAVLRPAIKQNLVVFFGNDEAWIFVTVSGTTGEPAAFWPFADVCELGQEVVDRFRASEDHACAHIALTVLGWLVVETASFNSSDFCFTNSGSTSATSPLASIFCSHSAASFAGSGTGILPLSHYAACANKRCQIFSSEINLAVDQNVINSAGTSEREKFPLRE